MPWRCEITSKPVDREVSQCICQGHRAHRVEQALDLCARERALYLYEVIELAERLARLTPKVAA